MLVFNLGTTLQIGQLVKPKLILGPLHRAVSTALPKDDVRIDSTAIKKVQLQKAFKTERQKDEYTKTIIDKTNGEILMSSNLAQGKWLMRINSTAEQKVKTAKEALME